MLLPDIPEELFEQRTLELKTILRGRDDIAAQGNAYGVGGCIERLIAEAENGMYCDKKTFYTDRNITNDRVII